ncbi:MULTISPECIES: ABC transporter permease [unclassified Hyphomicrobium]|uniref:ABC transporter permease n=1 Tax=unclassified Hyphomicrobium TaxID=2619925 RepID=UPI000213F842|nr:MULTISPECIES: ABC transporter permease [unclassified Hyphomicrobium]CCB63413.1 Inner-membrane translocator [Hyphomicrobium sp. MC1]
MKIAQPNASMMTARLNQIPGLSAIKIRDLALPIFIVLLAVTAGLIEPRFFSWSNFENLARQVAPLAIASTGQAFAIISGGLDLSIAAVMSLAGVAGITALPHVGIGGCIAVMLLTGGLAGLTSGFIIAYFKTTPLIVTLGMMSIAQAIALILSNGVPIYNVPDALTDTIGFGRVLGIPSTVIISSVTMIAGGFLLRRTIFGRYVYAIGSSRSATEKSGIDVPFYTMLVYTITGLTSGIGALVMTAWVGAAQPVAAPTLTLQSLAAVVLGGVALTGGSGSILQVFYGVLILGMLSNAMNMIGISDFYQTLTVGIVIILAVILDRFRRNQE